MTVYYERNDKTILDAAVDADSDLLTITKVNGQAGLVGVAIPISVGGTVIVMADGTVSFDDSGFSVPEIGEYVADGLIATVSDGTVEVEIAVNLELYGAASLGQVVFGALTRPFEGGYPAPEGATSIIDGDPEAHFAISNGMILPTLAGSGVLSGSYVLRMDTGAVQEISILPETFSVSKDDELSTLLNDASVPFDGKIVRLREAQFGLHALPSHSYVNGVTIDADGPGTKMRQLIVGSSWGNPEIKVRNIEFSTDEIETEQLNRLTCEKNNTPNGTLSIENCRFRGHPGINADPDIWYAKLDYTGATGLPQVGERIDNDGGGEDGAYTSILQVYDNGDGTGTLYVDDSPGASNGGSSDNQGVAWAIGQVMTSDGGWEATLSSALYGGDDSIGNGIEGRPAFARMYVEGCSFDRMNQAMKVVATEEIIVRGNIARNQRADFIKTFAIDGVPPTTRTLIERNLSSRGMCGSSDYGNPHRDAIQVFGAGLTENWRNLIVRDNIFWTGQSPRTDVKTNAQQCVWFPTKSSSGYGHFNATVSNNICDVGAGLNGIVTDYTYSSTYTDNVVVSTFQRNADDNVGSIRILLGNKGTDNQNTIARNITESLGIYGSDVDGGNVTSEKFFDFSAYFPAWDGVQDFTDLTSLLTSFTPGPGTAVMAGSTWIQGSDHGCVNEAGRFIGHDGTDLTDFFLDLEASFDNVTVAFGGALPSAFSSSDWSLWDDGSGGTLVLTISALPGDGGLPLSDLQYRIDGGAYVSLGSVAPGEYTLTGLTDGSTYSLELRAVNSLGASPASDSKSAVPSAGASVPGAFTLGDWSLADAGTGGEVNITITALPDAGGSPITGLGYTVDGGNFVDLGAASTGSYTITGLSDDIEVQIGLQAQNAQGLGSPGPLRVVTPTGEAALDESFAADEPMFTRIVYDRNKLNGGVTADIPITLSGASPNTALEARAIDSAGATTSWVSIGSTDALGDLSSTIMGIPAALGWYKWQVRKAAAPSEGGTTTGEFGVGDVIALMGQSPLAQSSLPGTNRPFTSPEVLTVVGINEGVSPLEVISITQADSNNETFSYLSEMIAGTSDCVAMLVDLMHSGTGRWELADDDRPAREWSAFQEVVDLVRDAGSEIGMVYETWHTSDATELANDPIGFFLPFYTGVDGTGAIVATGTTLGGVYDLDHMLFDLSGAGRGIFDENRTKLVFATPFGNGYEQTALNHFLRASGEPDGNKRVVFSMRENLKDLLADPNMQTVVAQEGPYANNLMVNIGGTIHLENSEFGRPHIYRNAFAACYLANGVIADDYSVTSLGIPEITGVTWAQTHVDVQVSVPAGRALTTTRLARGLAAIGSAQPYYTEVMGFELAPSLDRALSPSGFDAVVHDASAGIIRITPDSGTLENGARLTFGNGQSIPVYDAGDKEAGTHLNMPIVTCGAGEGYDGLPLKPNVTFFADAVSGSAPLAAHVRTPETGYSAELASNYVADQMTIEFIGSLSYTHDHHTLFDTGGNRVVLQINRDGGIRWQVKSGSAITLFNETTSDGTVLLDYTMDQMGQLHLIASVDRISQTANLWVKDQGGVFQPVLTPIFTDPGTPLISDRKLRLGKVDNDAMYGRIEKMVVWQAHTSTPDTAGLGTPYAIREGNAAAWNATTNTGTGPDFANLTGLVVDA